VPAGRDRFDQLGHRAAKDVEQRDQHLQGSVVRPLDNKPLDLAVRQPDPAFRQRLDQVGRGEQTMLGHHLTQVPSVVELACHRILA
jgi:hypothetical protein